MRTTTRGAARLRRGPNRIRERSDKRSAKRAKRTAAGKKKGTPKVAARPPRKQRSDAHEPTGRWARTREALGVVLAALSSALLLSLVSYRVDLDEGNLCGMLGQGAARGLLGTLGVMAYPMVVALGVVAALFVLGKRPRVRVGEALGILGAVPAAAVLLDLLGPTTVQSHRPGGAFGNLLASFGREVLSSVGTGIVAGATLVICLIVSADIRPSRVAGWIARGVRAVATPVGSFLTRLWVEVSEEWEARRLARAERAAREAAELQEPMMDDDDDALGDFEDEPSWTDGLASNHEKREEANDTDLDLGAAQRAEQESHGRADTSEAIEVAVGDIVELTDLPTEELVPPETQSEAQTDLDPEPAPAVEPKIVERRPSKNTTAVDASPNAPEYADFGGTQFQLPPLGFLEHEESNTDADVDKAELLAAAAKLEEKLSDYGVKGNVVEIHPGPVITMFEFKPAPGTRVSKIAALADDLAMALEAVAVRIVAPIPGKPVVGIEIPNAGRETVYLRDVLSTPAFTRHRSRLAIALGKDIAGESVVADLARMPHLLVAGATGSGKSVCLNAIVMSILYRATPDEVRMLMIDPKMLEFGVYDGIPHLLHPVVTDPKKATVALRWAVDEMERRYQLLAEQGVRKIANYNRKVDRKLEALAEQGVAVGDLPTDEQPRRLPHIVVIVDELADLMMVSSRDVETSIARLAQMARAAGIHLIVATQRPSVDVITGMIKANFPTRFAFKVATRTDSRTIIDENGAQHLLGRGDMLIMRPGSAKLERVHGAFVTEEEVSRVVDYLKSQAVPQYDREIIRPRDEDDAGAESQEDEADELYDRALAIATEMQRVSISMLQRRMKVGYNRAARMVERMERNGVVGPQGIAGKPRQVLISPL